MIITKLLSVLILSIFSSVVLAYGSSSSSKKACTKPRFTQFTPAPSTVVQPKSEFSLLASASTNPKTIKVNIKKLPVDVVIDKVNKGYSVKGTLPESLKGTFARVNIRATGTNKCKVSDGWLLQIGE